MLEGVVKINLRLKKSGVFFFLEKNCGFCEIITDKEFLM
jgi:hypothetical protein